MLNGRTLFIADTYVNEVPSAQLLAQIALQAVAGGAPVRATPKVAFLSHSNYGSSRRESAARMREAYEIFSRLAPESSATARCTPMRPCRKPSAAATSWTAA